MYNFFLSVIGTFISTVAGAFFASWFFKKIEDQEIKAIRKLAIKYIEETMFFSFYNHETKKIIFNCPDPKEVYSKGELNILDCFIIEIEDEKFYSKDGPIKRNLCKELKKEVKNGFWDYYLLLDKNTLPK